MSSQLHKHVAYDSEEEDRRYRDERRRSRSRRHNDRKSRSNSRSASLERQKRHRRRYSHSRSRSNSRNYSSRHEKRHSAVRRTSRSRSRSYTRRSRSNSRTRSKQQKHHRSISRSLSIERSAAEKRPYNNNNSGKCRGNLSSKVHASTDFVELRNLQLPKQKNRNVDTSNDYYNFNTEEPIDKERIHRETEEKLRQTLAKEGKVYPPPKPEPSHPVFANDGSFLAIFKKMQEAQRQQVPSLVDPLAAAVAPRIVASTSSAAYAVTAAASCSLSKAATTATQPPPPPPLVGRRRGGKILKTGMVAKPKVQAEGNADPKDFWSLYLAEVNKYKNNACESDGGTRPLVK